MLFVQIDKDIPQVFITRPIRFFLFLQEVATESERRVLFFLRLRGQSVAHNFPNYSLAAVVKSVFVVALAIFQFLP
jgi:hypothetical protein